MTRLGLVGLGNWGAKLARTIDGLDETMLAACYARSGEAREAFADQFGCRPAGSIDDLLADGLDGVLVATPHTTHVELVEEIAGVGMNVMVEKPLALTVMGAKRCISAAASSGSILHVAHYRRRLPATRAVKELIDCGSLGEVHLLEGHFSRTWGPQTDRPWRDDPDEAPAGSMTALGVHMADNLLYWGGAAVRLSALSSRIGGSTGIDDITGALIEFASGAIGTLTTSLRIPKLVRSGAHGSKMAAFSENDGLTLSTLKGNEDERSSVDFDVMDPVTENLAHFVECIRTNTQPETGGPEGLAVVEILEAMTLSAGTHGAPVLLSSLG